MNSVLKQTKIRYAIPLSYTNDLINLFVGITISNVKWKITDFVFFPFLSVLPTRIFLQNNPVVVVNFKLQFSRLNEMSTKIVSYNAPGQRMCYEPMVNVEWKRNQPERMLRRWIFFIPNTTVKHYNVCVWTENEHAQWRLKPVVTTKMSAACH